MSWVDFLVIGGGIAGLRAAVSLSAAGSVLVVTKESLSESNTAYAQGGIAVAMGGDEDVLLHLEDTVAAGDGLVNRAAAQVLVEQGPRPRSRTPRLGHQLRPQPAKRRAPPHPRRRPQPLPHPSTPTAMPPAARSPSPSSATCKPFRMCSLPSGPQASTCSYRTVASPAQTLLDTSGLHEVHAPRRPPRQRRRRPGLQRHHQPRRGHRRRHRHGLSCRRRTHGHGVLPVPPHRLRPPRSPALPHERSPARRRRSAPQRRRRTLHGPLPPPTRTRPPATSSPAPSPAKPSPARSSSTCARPAGTSISRPASPASQPSSPATTSISAAISSPSAPLHTTSWAASAPTSMAEHPSPAYTLPEKAACTGVHGANRPRQQLPARGSRLRRARGRGDERRGPRVQGSGRRTQRITSRNVRRSRPRR